eukprot:5368855-Pyramimonas_sp.AAC.2
MDVRGCGVDVRGYFMDVKGYTPIPSLNAQLGIKTRQGLNSLLWLLVRSTIWAACVINRTRVLTTAL